MNEESKSQQPPTDPIEPATIPTAQPPNFVNAPVVPLHKQPKSLKRWLIFAALAVLAFAVIGPIIFGYLSRYSLQRKAEQEALNAVSKLSLPENLIKKTASKCQTTPPTQLGDLNSYINCEHYYVHLSKGTGDAKKDMQNLASNLTSAGWSINGSVSERLDINKDTLNGFDLYIKNPQFTQTQNSRIVLITTDTVYGGVYESQRFPAKDEIVSYIGTDSTRYLYGIVLDLRYYHSTCLFLCLGSQSEDKAATNQETSRDLATQDKLRADTSYENTKIHSYFPTSTPKGYVKQAPIYDGYAISAWYYDNKSKPAFSVSTTKDSHNFKRQCIDFKVCKLSGKSKAGWPIYQMPLTNSRVINYLVIIGEAYVSFDFTNAGPDVNQQSITDMINSLTVSN